MCASWRVLTPGACITRQGALAPVISALLLVGLLPLSSCASSLPWQFTAGPNPGVSDNFLTRIAVVKANDIWAVGAYAQSALYQTLIVHWDGVKWSTVSSPNLGTGENYLTDVAAVSSRDVWAVGWYAGSDPASLRASHLPLIEHFDGITWSAMPSPPLEAGENELRGIAVVSSSDIWAVGTSFPASATFRQTLIEHWDGTSWNVVASPNLGSTSNQLADVAVVSPSDIWAVGHAGAASTSQPLIEHWDGTRWMVASSPQLGVGQSYLMDVAVVSATNLWAVGFFSPNGSDQTLIAHWDGASWSVVASPNPGASDNLLYGVAAVSATDAWAVGKLALGSVGSAHWQTWQTLIEHWDGSSWTAATSPNPGSVGSTLAGVAAVTSTELWAVGWYADAIAAGKTLILRYT